MSHHACSIQSLTLRAGGSEAEVVLSVRVYFYTSKHKQVAASNYLFEAEETVPEATH